MYHSSVPGTWMIELHSNTAIQGTTSQNSGPIRPTQDSVHETLEVTRGWTPWFETGGYIFTSIQQDQGWEWVGVHLRPRVRVPEDWLGPIGNFLPSSQQQQLLFAVVDLNFDPKWEFNFGVGVGLTHDSDGLILKLILGRRF